MGARIRDAGCRRTLPDRGGGDAREVDDDARSYGCTDPDGGDVRIYCSGCEPATIGVNRVGSVFPEEDCNVGSSGIQSERSWLCGPVDARAVRLGGGEFVGSSSSATEGSLGAGFFLVRL